MRRAWRLTAYVLLVADLFAFAIVLFMQCRALALRDYVIAGRNLGPDLFLYGGLGVLAILVAPIWVVRRQRSKGASKKKGVACPDDDSGVTQR